MDNFLMICGMYQNGRCPRKEEILAGKRKCDYAHEHYQGDDCDEVCTYGGRCVPVKPKEDQGKGPGNLASRIYPKTSNQAQNKPGAGPVEQASNLDEYLLTKAEINKAALIPSDEMTRIVMEAAEYARGNHETYIQKLRVLAEDCARQQIIKAQHEKTIRVIAEKEVSN
jgi:hypothetical protein